MKKMKVAILGSGNIGTDLLLKVLRSPHLECGVFIGRNLQSAGMIKAGSLGVTVSAEGIAYIEKIPNCCELVFDATSAKAHAIHAPVLNRLGKCVIDLTPAKIGEMCVPVVNMNHVLINKNINMITCGGQAAIPIAYALALVQKEIEYIEVVSSISSRSAGPATRLNLDEYIHTTEQAVKLFSGAKMTKAILVINPAEPCINMQTTIFAKITNPDMDSLQHVILNMVKKLQKYVPGYELIMDPVIENGRVVVMVRVKGQGDYLPEYAGNLDIINCAALVVAEKYAAKRANFFIEEMCGEIDCS